MRPIATDVTSSVVCVCVCLRLCVGYIWVSCVKMGESIEMPFGVLSHVGSFLLDCNVINLVFEILKHDKIWGTICFSVAHSKFWDRLLVPVIYAHERGLRGPCIGCGHDRTRGEKSVMRPFAKLYWTFVKFSSGSMPQTLVTVLRSSAVACLYNFDQ